MESFYNKLGLTTQDLPGTVRVGVSTQGEDLYANPQIVNNSTPDLAAKVTHSFQQSLNSIGAATPEDNAHLDNLKGKLSSPSTYDTLNLHRASGDLQSFSKAMNQITGSADPAQTKAAYDVWGALTPNQKGAAVMHIGGKADEYFNKEYLPGVNVKTAIDLQNQGIPMKAIHGNWDQVSALQAAIGHEGDSVSAIKRTARSGMLGPAQPLTEQDKSFYGTSPSPQYGVGAQSMPRGNALPKGYTVAGIEPATGKQIVVPQGNEASVAFNPQVNGTAGAVYSKWQDAGKIPATNGSQGGSNMYKNLTQLYDTNPKALGVALDAQIPTKGEFQDKAHGLAVRVLTTGDANGSIPMGRDAALQALTRSGVQNKDVGYKLANQAYAEGRINDSHLFTIQRSLDNAFNDDQALAHIAPAVGTPVPRISRLPSLPGGSASQSGTAPAPAPAPAAPNPGGVFGGSSTSNSQSTVASKVGAAAKTVAGAGGMF